ncbi:hypothetical protein BU23DRAFT_588386 [Bimuria novae-zelandiae CBS 107.79]|uniref:FAS1 domain-containing protein n=1 Tax=Bimuria novae-zelandiae CBS 107.79 TaxID=1447943 RepID=A0A6A5VE52_9PLEO|nr:hypothetical protein BU23DRAFT_588386 [Bimuria novae-zelandiae CBS 107.79]
MLPASLSAYPSAILCLLLAASADPRPLRDIIKAFDIHQTPLLSNPLVNMPSDETVSTGVIISDVIGKTQAIAIFSGLTRDIDPVSGRLDDASQNATVLAPNNNAMKNLKRKPWEDPGDYNTFGAEAYKGQDGEDRAHKNLRRFVERHIVPESPWEEGKKFKTLDGNEVWWESKDGKKKIQPADVEVTSIADKVANGEVWVLDAITLVNMHYESGDLSICFTCGTQFDAPLSSPPKNCPICDDPRQYVPPTGQAWTSLNNEASTSSQRNEFITDPHDPRIHYITTTPTAPSKTNMPAGLSDATTITKQLGIGERAILLQTEHGNVLWDLVAWLDDGTKDFIKAKGGLKAIVISHPHFWTTHLEWARCFGCPVYLQECDKEWLQREDKNNVRTLVTQPTYTILPGVTLIRAGGHFPGSSFLHWSDKPSKPGKLFIADTMMSVPSGFYHADRLPGTTSFSFMWAYPNMIPLPPDAVLGIWKSIKDFDFEESYGGFMGQNVRRKDLKVKVLESAKIFLRRSGHEKAAIYEETV